MAENDQTEVANMLNACGMTELLELKISRDIGRANNLEVWI
jgi:hypothetical protein